MIEDIEIRTRLARLLEAREEFVPPDVLDRVVWKIGSIREFISSQGWNPDEAGLGVRACCKHRVDVHDADQQKSFITGALVRYATKVQSHKLGYKGRREVTAAQITSELEDLNWLLNVIPGQSAHRQYAAAMPKPKPEELLPLFA